MAWKNRWIAGLAAALAVVLFAYGSVRHVSGAGYLEKRLSAMIPADGVNRVKIGSSNFNPLRGTFVIRNLEFLPDTLLLAQRVQAGTPPQQRYSATASSLRVDGIRLWPLLRGRLEADSVAIDGARVDVYLDRTVSHVPGGKPAILPHVSLKSMDRSIRIGVIRVTNTDIGYSEKARDGSKPGTIRFTDLHTRIAGAGRLDATFDYDLRPSGLSMTYRGTVTRMNAEPLNDLLVNLEGIRITSGVIDSTSFDFTVRDDVADGTVRVLYRDFSFEMVDKVTLDRSLAARLQTFIASKTRLNHANPSDGQAAARVVAVLRERPPESQLLRFLWDTLREGILTTLGT